MRDITKPFDIYQKLAAQAGVVFIKGATEASAASAKLHGERCEARREANRPWDKDGR